MVSTAFSVFSLYSNGVEWLFFVYIMIILFIFVNLLSVGLSNVKKGESNYEPAIRGKI